MQLDSKESDIEQLREKLIDLQQRMDNSSVASLQTDETDCNIAGRAPPPPPGAEVHISPKCSAPIWVLRLSQVWATVGGTVYLKSSVCVQHFKD